MIVDANQALFTLVGLDPRDVLGRPLADLGAAGDALVDHLHGLRTGAEQAATLEWTMWDGDGGPALVSLSSVVMAGNSAVPDQILVHISDVSDRRQFEQQLKHLADHDPAHRPGQPAALLGRAHPAPAPLPSLPAQRRSAAPGPGPLQAGQRRHGRDSAGDELIASVAGLLTRLVRETDLVARLGGDEFAVLLQHVDRAAAARVAATLVDGVRDHVRTLDGPMREVTLSLGAVMIETGYETPTDLLVMADTTMYQAKRSGRDGWLLRDAERPTPLHTGVRLRRNERPEGTEDRGPSASLG